MKMVFREKRANKEALLNLDRMVKDQRLMKSERGKLIIEIGLDQLFRNLLALRIRILINLIKMMIILFHE